jgi:hypothetical protein
MHKEKLKLGVVDIVNKKQMMLQCVQFEKSSNNKKK